MAAEADPLDGDEGTDLGDPFDGLARVATADAAAAASAVMGGFLSLAHLKGRSGAAKVAPEGKAEDKAGAGPQILGGPSSLLLEGPGGGPGDGSTRPHPVLRQGPEGCTEGEKIIMV